jgi:hypothetical protein
MYVDKIRYDIRKFENLRCTVNSPLRTIREEKNFQHPLKNTLKISIKNHILYYCMLIP